MTNPSKAKAVLIAGFAGQDGACLAKVENMLGSPAKAKEKLGWVPVIAVQEMYLEMVTCDLEQARQHALLEKNAYKVNVSVE